jgi:hypothetical protein
LKPRYRDAQFGGTVDWRYASGGLTYAISVGGEGGDIRALALCETDRELPVSFGVKLDNVDSVDAEDIPEETVDFTASTGLTMPKDRDRGDAVALVAFDAWAVMDRIRGYEAGDVPMPDAVGDATGRWVAYAPLDVAPPFQVERSQPKPTQKSTWRFEHELVTFDIAITPMTLR